MAEQNSIKYRVIATVIDVRSCPYYKIGDKIVFEEPEIIKEKSSKLCLWALSSLGLYFVAACRKTPKEDWINLLHDVQCPDPNRYVTFKLTREPI